MVKVVPAPLVMGAPLPDASTLKQQPAVPGNCCPCQCCGGAPPRVDVNKIVAAGGKYAQAADGRIVEYYVYGSDEADARIFLQIHGSGGTGQIFPRMKGTVDRLVENNIKGISISLSGNGLTEIDHTRRIGDWPNTDLRPVFEQEGIAGDFMVEGTSYGTSHALAVMHTFASRVTHAHLHVPYIPVEVRLEQGMAKYGADEQMQCGGSEWLTSADPRAALMFCMCHTAFHYCGAHKMVVDKKDAAKLDDEAGFAVSELLVADAMHCNTANGVHGNLHNSMCGLISEGWGFDPRVTDVSRMKIVVSYNDADVSSPTEHGKFLSDHYTAKAAKCHVNVGCGGHSSQMAPWAKGDRLMQMLEL